MLSGKKSHTIPVSQKKLKGTLFLAKRGQRPRVAGFIILSLKGLRRDEISCGVYGHVYLFLYLFICEVGVCRK